MDASRVFALLEITGDQAYVSASNDRVLRGLTIAWSEPGDRLPPTLLHTLSLNVALHKVFHTATKHWVLVCGSRGNEQVALGDLLNDWTLELVQQLAEGQDEGAVAIIEPAAAPAPITPPFSHITPKRELDTQPLVLCFQPIFDVSRRRVTRAEALLRYQSADNGLLLWQEFTAPEVPAISALADRWVLPQVLQRVDEWSERYGITAVHVNFLMHDDATLKDLLDIIAAASPQSRAALAIEINDVVDYTSPRFIHVVQSLAETGAAVGIELGDHASPEIASLRSLPISFVKVDNDAIAPELSDTWDVFVTRVQAPPNWERLNQRGVKFVQGYALEAPLTSADFEQWLKSGVVPQTVLV